MCLIAVLLLFVLQLIKHNVCEVDMLFRQNEFEFPCMH